MDGGADVEAKHEAGGTPALMMAAHNGHDEAVEALLPGGADDASSAGATSSRAARALTAARP